MISLGKENGRKDGDHLYNLVSYFINELKDNTETMVKQITSHQDDGQSCMLFRSFDL